MPRTEHSSGGEVEHEVSMAEGILLDVTELKFSLRTERDYLAQVVLQLECKYFFYINKYVVFSKSAAAFQRNSGRDLNPQPPF